MTCLWALSLCLIGADSSFDGRIERHFLASGVPGAAIRVVHDGRVVYRKTFGVADIEEKTAASDAMAFEIGSVSKQFVATALLMLVADGKVRLEDTLGSAFAGTRYKLPESWRASTIDQVLHHVSGIPDYEAIAGYDFYNAPRKPEDIIAEASKKEPEFQPGEKFDYSNTGYFLISMIVEEKSGMPVGRFLTKRIFEPLGMKSTYADVRPRGVKPMTGYHSRSGNRTKQPPIAWTSTLGAGGIVSTLDDMMKWDAALYTDKLVRQDLLSKIWTPGVLKGGSVNPYGYGWFQTKFRGVAEMNHSGQTNGFTCYYRRFPEKKLSVWAFANTYDGDVFRMVDSAAAHFVPGASYSGLPLAKEQEVERSAGHLKALKQAVSAEGDMALLAPSLKSFVTEERFKATSKELKGYLEQVRAFALVRVSQRKARSGALVDEYLYRQELASGEYKYWTLGFIGGLLSGLRVEDE